MPAEAFSLLIASTGMVNLDGARALRTGIAAFYGNGAKWTTIPHDEE
jgi:hypothetical protein